MDKPFLKMVNKYFNHFSEVISGQNHFFKVVNQSINYFSDDDSDDADVDAGNGRKNRSEATGGALRKTKIGMSEPRALSEALLQL